MRINYNKGHINDTIFYDVTIADSSDNYQIEELYNSFINNWNELYKQKQAFSMIFNLTQLSSAPPKYCKRLANYIKSIKKLPKQYSTFSIVVINNPIVKGIIGIIFKLTKPIAPMYIVESADMAIELMNHITGNNIILESFILINEIKVVYP